MKITANQVTLLRLFLLPLPVAMIYHGELHSDHRVGWLLAGLIVFVLLGLTDAVDGMLARRYGSTPLGGLLDPIVDKIFIVATLGPLADLRIVAPSLVVVLFVRELAVTVLRSIALEESFHFRTSRIAKLKTTVQMAGSGFILLIYLFPERQVIFWILGAAAAGSLVPVWMSLLWRRTPGWKAVSGAILICAVFAGRLVLSPSKAMLGIMVTIVGFTLVSGFEYFWTMRGVLWERFRRSFTEVVRLIGLSLAVPLCYLPAMQKPGAPIYAILLILAVELTAGGLDNYLVQAGRTRGPAPDLLRSAIQAVAGLAVILLLSDGAHPFPVHLLANAALLATLIDVSVRFYRNYTVFRIEDLSGNASGNDRRKPPGRTGTADIG
jgi:CDP-diacylglycerol--glycerol-3-phosphate 3-phosphatidyltransferase